MIKKLLLLLMTCTVVSQLPAQLNMTYKSHVEYNQSLSDIWGYAAPDNREYALVGLYEGMSVIDVTDTENPVIKGNIPGAASTWRDVKTWSHYAYMTNESSGGLLVVNLGNLPNDLTEDDYYYWDPEIPEINGDISACHNIYIDDNGYAYLTGCNGNDGGLIYLDVFTNPWEPAYAGKGADIYSHDVYVRDNLAYSSEIYEGHLAIYDVSDKANTQLLATQNTDGDFTHNAWLSDDSNFVFTTDEVANAPIGSYDISDLNNIQELDLFRPIETLGDGVIPHNVHVWEDWIIISYYSDGCIIVDGSRPENLIEVGNFDTYIPANTGFNGAWGAYPYLPSGTVLVSDIGNGCYILEPNYVRACWLEGKVTDGTNNTVINNVNVSIAASQPNLANTDPNGEYKTGLATAGTYSVTFSHPAYESLTVPAELDNGEITILNVDLNPLPSQSVSGLVVEESSGDPIPGAKVLIRGEAVSYETTSDANGNFNFSSVLEADYEIFAGAWGYRNAGLTTNVQGGPAEITIALGDGYADDFIVDLEWEVQGSADAGIWERGEPVGTDYQGNQSNPEVDVSDDLGDLCYVTGNAGGTAGNDDVDEGNTILVSPTMDLSTYNEPVLRFKYWFFNSGGGSTPNDNLTVTMTNGVGSPATIMTINQSASVWMASGDIMLNDYLAMTNDMQIQFTTADQLIDDNGHLVEAGIDAFEIFDANPVSTFDLAGQQIELNVSPNPFVAETILNYQFEATPQRADVQVFNSLGQLVQSQRLPDQSGQIVINDLPTAGVYWLQVVVDGKATEGMRLVKQ